MKAIKKKSAIIIRVLSILFAAVLQVAVIVFPYIYFRNYIAEMNIVFVVISFFFVLYVVRSDSEPIHKIPWIVILLAVPVFGWSFYLVYGHRHIGHRERNRMNEMTAYLKDMERKGPVANDRLMEISPHAAAQAKYLLDFADAPVFCHTKTQYFPLGDDMLPAMLKDLRSAKEYIYMEYFIVEDGVMLDSILEILKEKAAQGVDIRFMFDSFGSLFKVSTKFREGLKSSGIKICEYGSFRSVYDSRYNNRDHRKICVIDGRVAYTGGVNLADEYINQKEVFGHWKDTAIRLEGDAVYSMTLLFLTFWDTVHLDESPRTDLLPPPSDVFIDNGFVAPFTDYPGDSEYVGENVYLNIINHSHRYVYIMTPYLIIDNVMIDCLCNAAKCGIDVRIITPGIPDKKLVFVLTQSYYEPLLRAGVKIYEYTPGFVHAKMFVSDDEIATIGTINLDFRSLVHHFENGLWMCRTKAVSDIYEDFLQTQAKCHQVTYDECRRKSLWKKLILPILRLFAPMM